MRIKIEAIEIETRKGGIKEEQLKEKTGFRVSDCLLLGKSSHKEVSK